MRKQFRVDQAGFGLIELLIAMLILNVGILAIVAAFNAGLLTLNRASRITTASVLADQQMELYRAIKYESIRLDSQTVPASAPYTSDPAYTCSGCSTLITTPDCGSGPSWPPECVASRSATGADGKPYRVDTYVIQSNSVSGGRPIKQVTIVVRDGTNTSRVYARQASSFDQATG
jgi:Tfp pilus assembly protein PilE